VSGRSGKADGLGGRRHHSHGHPEGLHPGEIISYADFIAAGGETQAKRANKMRLGMKQYVVQDDLTNFRFNK
jgi:ribosome-binding ATPase YchF (GTP1/OBG family)